jgi:hypothetical protein
VNSFEKNMKYGVKGKGKRLDKKSFKRDTFISSRKEGRNMNCVYKNKIKKQRKTKKNKEK